MSKTSFSRLPGFRDFPPQALALRSYIFEAWRRVSYRYGFLEYDGPPLESLDLYTEKSGEEIIGQLYTFQDKGGRQVTLRPEMTPSLARILSERSRSLAKPIRWFSIPQLFRYERQQRGRLREHFQLNVDVIGEAGPAADVEVVAVAIDSLRELGLTADDFTARVSDRELLTALLEACGVPDEKRLAAFAVIDKLGRSKPDKAKERFQEEVGLTAEQAESVLALFEHPTLEAIEAAHGEHEVVSQRLAVLHEYLGRLSALGLGDYVEIDLGIVRGLAYYTGIVFELFDRKGELRAICGGGRYDDLLSRVGGEALPAVGFGMGDVVLGELLKERGLLPDFAATVDLFVIAVSDEEIPLALEIARTQREAGRSVVYALRTQNVRKQFGAAANAGAQQVVILGPEEVARGSCTMRDMSSGEEREVKLEELT